MLRFPDRNTIIEKLSINSMLKTDYNEEKGITKAIAELAAERFANSDKGEFGVKIEVHLLIKDLQSGKDSFAEKGIPDFGKLVLPSIV